MRPFAARAAQKNGFDLQHDYAVIVASFASAYGLRIRTPETHLPWPEFQSLLAGLPENTPLPRLIAVRHASDEEAEHLYPAARQARADWQLWLANQPSTRGEFPADRLEHLFRSFCGGSPLHNT